ncbi:MAG: hypothetical protein QXT37_09055 [Thermofilaceae archaeon]
MRVDALLVVAATVLAAMLLLSFYARGSRAYTLAFDCYARALEVAGQAAQNITLAGWSGVRPPSGFTIVLRYPDGRVLSRGGSRGRCYAYTLVSVNGTLLLVEAKG